jgi:hypothetical protein
LFHSTRAIIDVLIFLVALLVVRGLRLLATCGPSGVPCAVAAGFTQATSLTFIVVATTIGVQTGHQRTSTAAALVVAGLLSVIIYPPVALQMLKSAADRQVSRPPAPRPDPS